MEEHPKTHWRLLFFVTFAALLIVFICLVVERQKAPVMPVQTIAAVTVPPQSAQAEIPDTGLLAAANAGTIKNAALIATPAAVTEEKESAVKAVPADKTQGDLITLSVKITASFYNTFSENADIARLAKETGKKRLAELLSAHVARNLVWSLNMRKEVYPGDMLHLVFRAVPDDEQVRRADLPDEIELIAMRYQSIRLGKTLSFYSFTPKGRRFSAFYTEEGVAVERHLKNSPIREWIQITSLLKDRRPKHDGLDFKAPVGIPVFAPFSGTVIKSNWNVRFNGVSVEAVLDTSPQIYMVLLHLDRLYVKNGQHFKAGDHIADVGNSGRSFAPHLHYQLQKEPGKTRKVIDPLVYHGVVPSHITDADKTAFFSRVKELRSLLDKK